MNELVKRFLFEFPDLKKYFGGISIDKHGDCVVLEGLPKEYVYLLVERGWVRAMSNEEASGDVSLWRHCPEAGSLMVDPSNVEGISEPQEKKEINVIVTGRISKDTHDKIIDLLRQESVGMQFIPSFVELLPVEHQEPVSVSLQVCDIFSSVADLFLSEFSIHVDEAVKLYGNNANFPVLFHLADRLMSSPQHVTIMHREEPFFSYIDTSSLNRSNLEAAVTLLYFL